MHSEKKEEAKNNGQYINNPRKTKRAKQRKRVGLSLLICQTQLVQETPLCAHLYTMDSGVFPPINFPWKRCSAVTASLSPSFPLRASSFETRDEYVCWITWRLLFRFYLNHTWFENVCMTITRPIFAYFRYRGLWKDSDLYNNLSNVE